MPRPRKKGSANNTARRRAGSASSHAMRMLSDATQSAIRVRTMQIASAIREMAISRHGMWISIHAKQMLIKRGIRASWSMNWIRATVSVTAIRGSVSGEI
jgi:hypothetical protein